MLEYQALMPESLDSLPDRNLKIVPPRCGRPLLHLHLVERARRPVRESTPRIQSTVPHNNDASLPILIEDLAPLCPILSALEGTVAYQVENQSGLRVLEQRATTYAWTRVYDKQILGSAVSLRRPTGQSHATLGLLASQSLQNAGLERVLETTLSTVAKAIEERWFRLQYRKSWIVAAAPVKHTTRALLLACDQSMALRAVDSQASRWLGLPATESHQNRWEDFFRPIATWPSLRVRVDLPMRLTGARDGESWTAILTAPDFSASTKSHDALLHARPRLHGLADLTTLEPEASPQIPSLTPGMRRKIEEFIEARLDMPLSVECLAEAAGMSCSHFTRAFRNVLKMTPHRYVMWRRLLRAQDLIKSSDSSIAEIALVTGFADQSHLCRLFQLNMGETPSRFRRLCR